MDGYDEPRLFTPPLRPLTPDTTLGYSVIEFSDGVLEMELLPWQRWLLLHMLELREDGTLRFRTVVVLMARQNGKSTLSQVLALWFMYVYGAPLVIGSAQDLDVAEEIWQGVVDLVEDVPELDALKDSVVKVNGKKALILATGERYKVKAANRRAGRGLSGNLVLLDELREHQTWEAWGALTKTTMARAFALVLALSNAGDATSVVLRYLRQMGHAALGDPDGLNADDADSVVRDPGDEGTLFAGEEDTLGLFEWSAAPQSTIRDRDGWAHANPALGHTITERAIASAANTDPEWVFRTEVLCQWTQGTLEGPFPPDAWERCADADSQRALDAPVALAVDVAWDRSTTHIALASTRPDGLPHIEIIASRAGTDWVVSWLTSPDRSDAVRNAPVGLQAKGAPASSLIGPLKEAGVAAVEWGGVALGVGTGQFYDRIRAAVGEGTAPSSLRHRDQPILNLAAATAVTRPVGDSWYWDRKRSPTDVSPLVAATGALWLLTSAMPPPRKESAYAHRRLEVF